MGNISIFLSNEAVSSRKKERKRERKEKHRKANGRGKIKRFSRKWRRIIRTLDQVNYTKTVFERHTVNTIMRD